MNRPPAPIRILIVDDHPVFRQGLRQILQQNKDFDIVADCSSVEQALVEVRKQHPDVLLLDISMPGLNGIDMTRQICSEHPQVHVAILSMHNQESYILQALDAGAMAYVLKGSEIDSIIEAIRCASRGEYFLCPQIRGDIIARFLSERRGGMPLRSYDVLSEREQQVFRLLAEGHSTIQISALLFVSPKTVEKHRVNLMKKLKFNNLVELTKYAISLGIVQV